MKNGIKSKECFTVRAPREYNVTKIAQKLGMSRAHFTYLALKDYIEKNNLSHTVSDDTQNVA